MLHSRFIQDEQIITLNMYLPETEIINRLSELSDEHIKNSAVYLFISAVIAGKLDVAKLIYDNYIDKPSSLRNYGLEYYLKDSRDHVLYSQLISDAVLDRDLEALLEKEVEDPIEEFKELLEKKKSIPKKTDSDGRWSRMFLFCRELLDRIDEKGITAEEILEKLYSMSDRELEELNQKELKCRPDKNRLIKSTVGRKKRFDDLRKKNRKISLNRLLNLYIQEKIEI